VLSNQQTNQIIFFLGAGASVDAGLPDVVGLVNKFLESQNIDRAGLTQEVLNIIKDWKAKQQNDKTPIDIEIT
jgi:hypothetical protein